jgi:hypothetical protein
MCLGMGSAGSGWGILSREMGVFMWGYSVGDRFKRYSKLSGSSWLQQLARYVRAGDGLLSGPDVTHLSVSPRSHTVRDRKIIYVPMVRLHSHSMDLDKIWVYCVREHGAEENIWTQKG